MGTWSLILLGVCLLVSNGTARKWNTNQDSIVVDAKYSDDEEGELHFDALDQPDRSECMTLDQEAGICVTLRRCHPILFGENGELRNPSLAQDYSQSIDACASQNALDDDGVAFDEAEKPSSSVGDRILCCAKDKIQYAHRSSLETSEEELALYPTTTIQPPVALGVDLAPEEVEELFVIDSGGVSGPPSESVTEFIETTGQPEVSQQPQVTSVPLSQVDNVDFEGVTGGPVGDIQEPQQPVSASPEIPQPDVPSEVCSPISVYNTWPTFEKYPFLAAIQTRTKSGPVCSGSLIDSRHILTAAHCLHRFNSKDVARMQVRIGFTKYPINDTFNDFHIERKASKIIFHKRFHEQSKMDNNIALVELDEPVEFDEHVAPIGIFNGAEGFDAGNCSGVEAGWIKYGNRKVTGISGGVIQYVEPPISNFVLREAINRIYTNVECQTQLLTQITEDMLCAKTDVFEAKGVTTDHFRGNDGGPLVIKVGDRVQQVGIKSWAYEGNQYPTVYTRIDTYLDWIRNNLQI